MKLEKFSIISEDSNEKFGVKHSDGNVIIPPIYESMTNIYKNHVWVFKDNVWEIINSKKQVIYTLEWGSPNGFFDGISRVEVNGKYGFINYLGKWVSEPIYEDVCHFHKEVSFVKIKKDSFWGMISTKGKLLYNFEIENFWYIDKKKILIKKNNSYIEIDKNGIVFQQIHYDEVDLLNSFSQDGLFKVKKNDKWGIADNNWDVICPFIYSQISDGYGDLIAAKKDNGKWGYIDKFGKKVIPFKFDYSCSFNEKIGIVGVNDKYGAIDRYGKFVIPLAYDSLDDQWANIYAEKDGYFFYLTHKGVFIPDLIVDKIENYWETA